MSGYETLQNAKKKLKAEADAIAIRNGSGSSGDWGEYRFHAGQVKGLNTAIDLINESLKEQLGEIDLD